jgi:hypothetical protein
LRGGSDCVRVLPPLNLFHPILAPLAANVASNAAPNKPG